MKTKERYHDWSFFSHLPSKEKQVDESHLNEFFRTMFERQEVWYKRFILKEDKPWTQDQYLADYKFTNVYRELDNHSQYLIKNVLIPEDTNALNLVWKIFLFRIFNQPSTFSYIEMTSENPDWVKSGFCNWAKFNKDEFARYISEVRECGQNPYTSAYLINSMACPGMKRDDCYTKVVIPTIHKNIPNIIKKFKEVKEAKEFAKYLESLPGVGGFVAHELFQDLTYIDRYCEDKFHGLFPFNQNDFTNVGPGAEVGIRLIFPDRTTSADKLLAIYELREIGKDALEGIGQFKYLVWDREERKYGVDPNGIKQDITLHQIEMWLCEYQKYWKMTIGVGKQRSKFKPRTK